MFRDLRRAGVGTVAGVGLLAALTLTGCGGEGAASAPTTGGGAVTSGAAGGAVGQSSDAAAAPATSKPATPHNQADIAFASAMIPHNVQVLATTQIAGTRAAAPGVKALATKLSAAQVPQIEKLSSWLAGWGAPVPSGGTATTPGTGITQNDLVKLSGAAPAGFDKLWLTTMITHEQRALALAKAEVAGGSSAEAKALAKQLLAEQKTQITTMQGLLKKA